MSMKCIFLEPNFYIVKLGFAGAYLNFLQWYTMFLIFDPKHRLWVPLRMPRSDGSNVYIPTINVFLGKKLTAEEKTVYYMSMVS